MNLNEIKSFCHEQKLHWTGHALKRMFQRRISTSEIVEAIGCGEIIEEYPDDYPYPSCLLLGYSAGSKPLHIVCSVNLDDGLLWIITVYEPEPQKWSADFKTRKDA